MKKISDRTGAFWVSNRYKHFLYAIPVAFLGTVLMAVGCAGGMEFKDYQAGGKWDWTDFLFTCLGGLVGQILQLLLVWLVIILMK